MVRGVKIGVLGGIGPEATGLFYSKLISELQARKLIKSNKDFPQIIINSIPAKELIHDNHSEDDLAEYIRGLKELEKLNVDFIVIVCNTIHFYFEKLQNEISVPIIDLRDEVKKHIVSNKISSLTVLGTPTTVKKNLYSFQNVFNEHLTDQELYVLSEAIYDFNKGFEKEKQIEKVQSIASKYTYFDNSLLLACTEFSVMLRDYKNSIDVMDILINSTIEKFIFYNN